MSEAFIFASTNPQLSQKIVLENCMLRTSGEHVVYINCSESKTKNNLCTQHVLLMFWACNFQEQSHSVLEQI